jgi:dTDP-4-amino-4,6-dideoxygalactose transaminase
LNSRLDALQAAVLRVKLAHLDKWTQARQENAKRYAELFRHYKLLDAIELPATLPDRRHVFNQYSIRVKGNRRDKLLASLREQKIGAAIYYPQPLHLQNCFAHLGYKQGDFPEAESISAQVLSLPIYPEVGAAQQELVVRGIARALDKLESTNSTAGAIQPKYLRHGGTRAA